MRNSYPTQSTSLAADMLKNNFEIVLNIFGNIALGCVVLILRCCKVKLFYGFYSFYSILFGIL